MYNRTFYPFHDYELRDKIEKRKSDLADEIERLSRDVITANSLDILADNFYEKYRFFEVTIGDEDMDKRDLHETKIKEPNRFADYDDAKYFLIDGLEAVFYYPFDGDEDLFRCRPSTQFFSYPNIGLENGYVVIRTEHRLAITNEPNGFEQIINSATRMIEQIRKSIGYANNDVSAFNRELRNLAMKRLQSKKDKVERFLGMAKQLQIPVQRNEYSVKHIPLQRAIKPIATKCDRETSYTISDVDYADILSAIKHTGSTYERTPDSYKSMHEEDLRNTLLATLNATYKGMATGETFREAGKTDICIETESRAAFIAECKMWTGQKKVEEAVKQLDSYTTWRDCKTALIYFVRNQDFLKTVDAAKEAINALPMIRGKVKDIDRNEFDFSMDSISNAGQILHVRVMLFNMQPSTKA